MRGNKLIKYILLFIIIFSTFISGILVGRKIDYQPIVYKKYYTDNTTGVQYMVVTSKDGGVAIFPRLNLDGTLYIKENFIYLQFGTKGEIK